MRLWAPRGSLPPWKSIQGSPPPHSTRALAPTPLSWRQAVWDKQGLHPGHVQQGCGCTGWSTSLPASPASPGQPAPQETSSPGGLQHFVEQLLRDFAEVDLCPHQRDQVHFQPLLAGGGELLLLVLRTRKAKSVKESIPGLSAPSSGLRRCYQRAPGDSKIHQGQLIIIF